GRALRRTARARSRATGEATRDVRREIIEIPSSAVIASFGAGIMEGGRRRSVGKLLISGCRRAISVGLLVAFVVPACGGRSIGRPDDDGDPPNPPDERGGTGGSVGDDGYSGGYGGTGVTGGSYPYGGNYPYGGANA